MARAVTSHGTLATKAMSGRVLCWGETMAVVHPEQLEPLATARRFAVSVAGAESNVAMSLAKMGDEVAWFSRLGEDALGDRVLREIAAAGVDVSTAVRDGSRPTGLMVKDPSPGARKVQYYRRGSAASAMGPGAINALSLEAVEWIHLSGITLALSPSCRSAAATLLRRARKGGIVTSFDVNYRPGLWGSRREAARVIGRLARLANTVLVGLDEAHELWGCTTASDVRGLFPHLPNLVVKDGAIAATAFGDHGVAIEPALSVEPLDTVGAGDAFAAGWIHASRRGMSARARLRLGHLLGASALRSVGDVPLITVPTSRLEAIAADLDPLVPLESIA
jgi:2-dehydro-3-deoxygluconokinase